MASSSKGPVYEHGWNASRCVERSLPVLMTVPLIERNGAVDFEPTLPGPRPPSHPNPPGILEGMAQSTLGVSTVCPAEPLRTPAQESFFLYHNKRPLGRPPNRGLISCPRDSCLACGVECRAQRVSPLESELSEDFLWFSWVFFFVCVCFCFPLLFRFPRLVCFSAFLLLSFSASLLFCFSAAASLIVCFACLFFMILLAALPCFSMFLLFVFVFYFCVFAFLCFCFPLLLCFYAFVLFRFSCFSAFLLL